MYALRRTDHILLLAATGWTDLLGQRSRSG